VYHAKKDATVKATSILIEEGYGVEYHGQSKEEVHEAHLENRQVLIKLGIIDPEILNLDS